VSQTESAVTDPEGRQGIELKLCAFGRKIEMCEKRGTESSVSGKRVDTGEASASGSARLRACRVLVNANNLRAVSFTPRKDVQCNDVLGQSVLGAVRDSLLVTLVSFACIFVRPPY
jgi:hypothetical protein